MSHAVKKSNEANAADVKDYYLKAVGIQRLTRGKLEKLVKAPRMTVPRNPFKIKSLVHTNWDETVRYLKEMCGVNTDYLIEDYHVALVANLLMDHNIHNIWDNFRKTFNLDEADLYRESREEILEVFFTRYFNKVMYDKMLEELAIFDINRTKLFAHYRYKHYLR